MPVESQATTPTDQAGDNGVLVLTRVLDAPRELVFKVWTEREHLLKWSAPHGFKVTHSEGDVRDGGTWRSCMQSPEGEDLWLGGVYREVVKNERLVMTHTWDEDAGRPPHATLVTITFADHEGDKTLMTFRQENFRSVASREGHEGGWTEAFERLSEYVKDVQSQGVG